LYVRGIFVGPGTRPRSAEDRRRHGARKRPFRMRQPPLIAYFRHEMANVWNKYVRNDRRGWERMYALNYGAKLASSEQSARHWVIAGIVAELGAARPHVLDVGCGCGTTYPHLRLRGVEYRGIDLSATAVAVARASYAQQAYCAFEVADFDTFVSELPYDVVILNEVLYYFPARRAADVLKKAHRLLRAPNGVLIVSMSHSLKSWLAWKACHVLPRAVKRVSVQSHGRSNRWTIAVFPREATPSRHAWAERSSPHVAG
jgi:2-polyprenyl-3-methyl-5-hydroxy-6-metoxy-1,4-benzoquinol methylase